MAVIFIEKSCERCGASYGEPPVVSLVDLVQADESRR